MVMMLRSCSVRLPAVFSLLALAACSTIDHRRMPAGNTLQSQPAQTTTEGTSDAHAPGAANRKRVIHQQGEASYYGARFHGRMTASGEPFDKDALTAASPTLPLGSHATVTNRETGKSVQVEVTDRMPSKTGRVIDLSERAAEHIGMKESGTALVRIEARRPRPGAP